MELNFLGRGGAFNTKEGNNAAYFVENNELFLIDCGETVFESLNNGFLLIFILIYVFILYIT